MCGTVTLLAPGCGGYAVWMWVPRWFFSVRGSNAAGSTVSGVFYFACFAVCWAGKLRAPHSCWHSDGFEVNWAVALVGALSGRHSDGFEVSWAVDWLVPSVVGILMALK
ncbi:hypothetical protein NDU88_002391 [Pleurodeles waltl]|uniref:Uncharacterized protein n=1 Tax=Pleurodeles waltl TaxID=8319 RepID=A0AAV7SAT5_PLEWA|nr:hypothetical protein NDU88_002391 [Pleurodeles waltl]